MAERGPPVRTAAWRSELDAVIDRQIDVPTPEGQTIRARFPLSRFANLVKLPHTVFALPFALLGVIYASHHEAVTIRHTVLVVLAFTAARFVAMGFNRIVDRDVDGLNSRTRAREIPMGTVSLREATVAVVLAGIVFLTCAALLNPLCAILAPLALIWILAYSYTKRFTRWSHLWLGTSLAIAPAGGYLAVIGGWSDPWWVLPVIAVAVASWVAGFDMFYALQDEVFDRKQGLKSVVVSFGRVRSILLAKSLHGATIAALVAFGAGAGLGVVYYVGVACAAGILVWEHRLVQPNDLSRLDAAFFTMNGVMSIVVFIGALGDRLL